MKAKKTLLSLSFALSSVVATQGFSTDVQTYQLMKGKINQAYVKVNTLRGQVGGGGNGDTVNPLPENDGGGGGGGGDGSVNPFPGNNGGGGGGGFDPNNPWGNESDLDLPDFANFNENDFLAGSTLARAGSALLQAGQAADSMLANLQAGRFSNATAFFGRACSQLGMARLAVSTANFQAGQPPMGILAQWGSDFRDVIDMINFARTAGSATCP